MRLFVLLVAATLLKQCTGGSITGTIHVEFGLYCPDKTDWQFKLSIEGVDKIPPAISGKATNHFEFRTMDNELTTSSSVGYHVEHTCTSSGKWKHLYPFYYTLEANKITYDFIGLDLVSGRNYEYVYGELFAHYLKNECPTGDCSDIYKRVTVSCGLNTMWTEQCSKIFEKTFKIFLESRPSSSPPPNRTDAATGKSNTTTFIIIGSVVGVVLLIALVVTYFLCKKKKKANNQSGSGMSGTGTNSKTMTKSGTTKQGTTTGTFQKTGTVGTGNTGNTTTGGQRY